MQLGRCPVCHARIGLDQCVQDEAGRELLALLATLDTATGTALVGYLGLFRSAHRDLANDRALRIAREVEQITSWSWLVPALVETVESMREKRKKGDAKPLANHNYLKRVLESTMQRGAQHTPMLSKKEDAAYQSATASVERLNDLTWANK